MIVLSRSAATTIFSEVARWVERGIEGEGAPLESLLYPLSALVPAAGMISPLELIDLEHVRELVIDDAAIPPETVKAFSAFNCHFSSTDMERANREFNAAIDARLARRPRLAVVSKLHSHPFAGGAFLSGGDRYHGIAAPAAVAWRRRRGLSTAFLHVVYPDRGPVRDARPWRVGPDGARGAGAAWRVRSWGTRPEGTLVDLGDARIVPDRDPLIRAVRRPPYWATRRGARWCDGQKAALRAAGYSVSRNLLGRGWRRYLVTVGDGRQIVLALPPDLPAAPPRVLEVRRALADEFEPLPLPAFAASPTSLSSLSLARLVRHYCAAGPS